MFALAVCSEGYYGYNCKENCSMTCGVPGRCDRVTGSCNGSCLSGWKEDMCEIGNLCKKKNNISLILNIYDNKVEL